MGMFDYIRCDVTWQGNPLLSIQQDALAKDVHAFQTKDTPSQDMNVYSSTSNIIISQKRR